MNKEFYVQQLGLIQGIKLNHLMEKLAESQIVEDKELHVLISNLVKSMSKDDNGLSKNQVYESTNQKSEFRHNENNFENLVPVSDTREVIDSGITTSWGEPDTYDTPDDNPFISAFPF